MKSTSSILPDIKKVKIPYKCNDGYLVKTKQELPFHLLIDKIIDEIKKESRLFHDAAIVIYEQLEKPEKINFSLAILQRYRFLKESDQYDFGKHYLYPEAAYEIFEYIEDEDLEVYTSIYKFYNSNNAHYGFDEEEKIIEKLVRLFRIQKFPKELINEIKPRSKSFEKKKKEYEKSGHRFDYKYQYFQYQKLLGKYDPIKVFQKELDPNFAKGKIEKYFHDDFPKTKNDPYYDEQEAVEIFLTKEIEKAGAYGSLKNCPTIKEYNSKDKTAQKNFFIAFFQRLVWTQLHGVWNYPMVETINLSTRKKLPFTEDELIFVLLSIIHPQCELDYYFGVNSFFKNVASHIKNNGLSDAMKDTLIAITKVSEKKYDDRNLKKLQTKVREVLAVNSSDEMTTTPFFFDEQDHFGVMAANDLKKANAKIAAKWFDLLHHASSANTGKPSTKWIAKATPLVKAIGQKTFLKRIKSWIDFINKMELTQMNEWYSFFFHQNNVPTIKGLIWCLSLLPNEELDQDLEKLIARCFKKIPGVGPTSGALGNACIYTVAQRNSLGGVALLNRVHSKVNQRNTKALIQKYIATTAEELNISISDLEDFSIQDFGLKNGVKAFTFNDYKARLTLASFGKTMLEWFKPDGKPQKSVPAFVRKDFAGELKAIRNDAKLIPKTLTIQRDRLDRSYIQKRALPYPHFEQYYFNHGLMSFLTKKLIWNFTNGKKTTTAIWLNDQWQDVKGKKITTINEKTKVQLWHPLHSTTKEILQWRNLLQEYQIKQPLKQAYREIYILTDAEVNTKVYSNRMAAHILKQHQFNVLAVIRGWKYKLMGWYDDGIESQTCSLKIPDYNLQVEFWINELNAEGAHNDTGIWNYVATDQVRFTQDEETVDLIDIPKIIFSEAMRDVDLFVGVGSVGNDPAWQDNGGLPQFNDYWQSYSFGDLTEVAKTRKTILEKLLPRLKIAKVASIQGKFLVVEGKVRTYKIHIGSTNILMEPNDQYLCIVPARGAGTKNDKLFIPFEGDRGFSILLSKAFMLAEDDKITDKTILTQIR